MIIIHAKERKDTGKSSSRRLRLKNRIPAIIYGGNKNPNLISIDHSEFLNAKKKEEVSSSNEMILFLNEENIHVKIQFIQYHSFKPIFMHIDFIRLNKKN